MSTIKCLYCHEKVDLTENFCPHCGKAIEHSMAKHSIEKEKSCTKCGHTNQAESQFCEQCGEGLIVDKSSLNSFQQNSSQESTESKILHSKGSYSGTMIKGKTSKLGLFFKVFIVFIIIAFIAWYNLDPDTEETLGDILFSAVFMLIFGFFIWLKRPKGSRKKRKKEHDEQEEKKLLEDMDEMIDDSDAGDGD